MDAKPFNSYVRTRSQKYKIGWLLCSPNLYIIDFLFNNAYFTITKIWWNDLQSAVIARNNHTCLFTFTGLCPALCDLLEPQFYNNPLLLTPLICHQLSLIYFIFRTMFEHVLTYHTIYHTFHSHYLYTIFLQLRSMVFKCQYQECNRHSRTIVNSFYNRLTRVHIHQHQF